MADYHSCFSDPAQYRRAARLFTHAAPIARCMAIRPAAIKKGWVRTMSEADAIREVFTQNNQGHIFAAWNTLSPTEQDELIACCKSVDFNWLNARCGEFQRGDKPGTGGPEVKIAPPVVQELPKTDADRNALRLAREKGEEMIRAGKTAAFLVAGGQGTRLGYNGPKGCFSIGPVSDRTLFNWHAEQIHARGKRYGVSIPWYIMTSRDNSAATRQYFEENNYLGLPRQDVFFFEQGMVPSIDKNGKLLLASPSRLAMNPDGHGGALAALCKSGAIDDMQKRGVEVLGSFQVDNPLITICDPAFFGFHALAGAEMSSKVLRKISAEEKIGLAVILNDKTAVIEYSDLDEASMHARNPDGELTYWAGSIGIHAMNVDFVRRIGTSDSMPWHQAIKAVPFFDGKTVVKPADKNAVKFETFIFDAIPFASASVNFEVKREDEFAPVKNATGEDSADSCRRLMSDYFGKWLTAMGVTVPANKPFIEIGPLYSLDADDLAKKVGAGALTVENRLLLD